MDWINLLLIEHSSLQAIVIVSLICAIGMALGKVKIAGISLGVTFVFFIGIIAGHIGLSIDPAMLKYAENFGLVIFVYALGLQVGPGFFSSLAHGGVKLNVLGLSLALLTLITAIALTYVTPVSIPDMMGLFCGATTNTPALGAVASPHPVEHTRTWMCRHLSARCCGSDNRRHHNAKALHQAQ